MSPLPQSQLPGLVDTHRGEVKIWKIQTSTPLHSEHSTSRNGGAGYAHGEATAAGAASSLWIQDGVSSATLAEKNLS